MDCDLVRRGLSDGDRRRVRGLKVRAHLHECQGCREFKDLMGTRRSASTTGGAVLVSYALSDDWKIAGRAEYISSSGSVASGAPNLLYAPGSDAWSFTITPTYQHGIFFARGEASYVGIGGSAAGYAFGLNLDKTSQARLMLEAGVLF